MIRGDEETRLIFLQMMVIAVTAFFILWGGGLAMVQATLIFGGWLALTVRARNTTRRGALWMALASHVLIVVGGIALVGYGVYTVQVVAPTMPDLDQATRFLGGVLALIGGMSAAVASYGIVIFVGKLRA